MTNLQKAIEELRQSKYDSLAMLYVHRDNALALLESVVNDPVGGKEDKEADLEKQEKLTSALWGFAYDLQHEPHDMKEEVDGTTINVASFKRAVEIIAGIFKLKLQEIQ